MGKDHFANGTRCLPERVANEKKKKKKKKGKTVNCVYKCDILPKRDLYKCVTCWGEGVSTSYMKCVLDKGTFLSSAFS
ncbi:hypothetical protein POVWA1_006920 [Plasmodium ovale wallikeri]|uniref:Uncharacterized protein n=1 Tax=Plasmodium ovale wallikeri TaxID=864142 RepID=A0A1A8YIL6_PLAOA|nr:hypothetical protein POVWA1_006920 [Plasmodium ovale wallikeri]